MADGIKQIAVVGAGIMGHGIAQVCAQAGKKVSLVDLTPEILQKARLRIADSVDMLCRNGLLDPAQAGNVAGNIALTTRLDQAVCAADLVFEVIPEKVDPKRQLFEQLDQLCQPEAIFATNTSAIPITRLSGFSRRPERVIGTHFFNPAQLIPLVEVITTARTEQSVLVRVMSCLTAAGKQPVHVKKDVPGFIGNRLQHAMMREALYLAEQGVANPEEIDTVVKSSFALRLLFSGPFEQRDLNGLDTQMGTSGSVFPDLSDMKEPPALLRDKVARGELGLKAGKGYYDWSNKNAAEVTQRKNQQLVNLLKFLHADR